MSKDLRMNDLPDFEEDGTIYDNHGLTPPASVIALHNNIMRALRKAFPQWHDCWLIRVDTRGGIVQIYNTAFTGRMGFVVHIETLNADPNCKRVVDLAGELFERYGIARGRGIAIKQALADLKRDPLGRPIYEK